MSNDQTVVKVGEAEIPKIGFGTWQNTGEQCARSVKTALEVGYRHIDTAQMYDNEQQVGNGIKEADVDREDIFLTTKLWRSNLRSGDVQETVHESLDRLDTEYIDLLLIHWPHPRVPVEQTLKAMEDLRDDGLISHLGVSNFTTAQFREARDIAESPLVTNQVLYNPLKDQSNLREFLTDHDLSLTAYSPLAHGDLIEDEMLTDIGSAYDKTAPQVAIRWLIQQERVIVIPKATSPAHIKSNLDVFDFELTDREMQRIRDRTPGLRGRLRNRMPSVMRRLPI
jgi:diketogulonate reductase-like aldo/keto reductase